MKLLSFAAATLLAAFANGPFQSGAPLPGASRPAASQPARPRDPQVARARDRYQPQAWPRSDRRPGLDLGLLKLHNYDGAPVEAHGGNTTARRFAPAGEKSVYLYESWVFETVDDAQEKLVELLAFVSSPGPVPTAQASGVNIGDIGYIGFSGAAPGAVSWIAWVRANVVVRIQNLDTKNTPAIDARAAAQVADAAILAQPKLLENEPLPKPSISQFSLGAARANAGDAVPITLAFSGANAAAPRAEWVVGGPGQGYVERAADGNFMFYSTGAGAVELVLHLTNENGVTSTAKATIDILAK